MHIRELQLIGFKSFQDKATLRFSSGMNAVIGPNGCGKTNILDALRWVLGEQSFALLRCAKNEDLIFGGTATVPGTNYAEVKLTLGDDETGQDIEIRRRYFRSGESEYYLNRQACRLRDIQEVFLSTGTGTKAYSIFDLRQMREIISGNIRRMFEEAASLAKYHEAKADCLRKFELTDKDLVRLDDIIAERERFVRSLQRQAGKQRAWDKLRAEEKGLRLVELKADYEATRAELERVAADAETLEGADAERTGEIHRLEEEQRSLHARLRDQQAHREELDARLAEARTALAGLENRNLLDRQRVQFTESADGEAAGERAALDARLAELDGLLAGAMSRLAEAGAAQARAETGLEAVRGEVRGAEELLLAARQAEADLQANLRELLEEQHAAQSGLARLEAADANRRDRRERLESERAALEERAARLAAELESARASVKAAQDEAAARRAHLEGLRGEAAGLAERRETARSEVEALRAERAGLEAELAALRAALALDQADAVSATLGIAARAASELVAVEPGWERACEAALYALVDFLVTAEPVAADGLERLAAARPDLRFGFLAAAPEGGSEPMPAGPGIAGRLADHVRLEPGAPAALGRALAQVLVAEDAAAAGRLAAAHPGWSFVTADGVCRFGDGRVVAEARERGRLTLAGTLRAKSERLAAVAAGIDERLALIAGADRRLEELDRDSSALEVALAELESDRSGFDARAAALAAQAEETGRDIERLRAELRSLGTEGEGQEQAAVELRAALAGLEQRIAEATAALERARAETAARETAVRAGLERASAALAALGEARQAASRLEAECGFARRQIDETRARIAALESLAAARAEERRVLGAGIAEREPALEQARQRVADFERQIESLRAADLGKAEEELAANLAELRARQEQNRQLVMDQRLRVHELRRALDGIIEEARASYGTDIAAYQPETDADVTARLDQIRRRIAALGQVNPLAEQEYRQEKDDLERLRSQRGDVAAARANLEQTLKEIDGHAREAFAATYAEVRGHFQEVFRQLFLEGEADLVMTDAQNPLESEIAIVARPRGKNPKRLEQLSDGEKALLAVSLLFAFYKVKPAPFCFLDEVDAPLDDANVGRFADYLKAMSQKTQVVIITHNRLTVERADVLFGVTAEQPGISTLVSVSLAEYQRQQEAAGQQTQPN